MRWPRLSIRALMIVVFIAALEMALLVFLRQATRHANPAAGDLDALVFSIALHVYFIGPFVFVICYRDPA